MTDEFLTQGLQNDRYLKALQLIEQFEDEIEATLRRFGKRMVDEHPGLFPTNPDGDEHANRSPSSVLAHTRINYPMTGPRARDTDQTWKLNVHLYWVDPAQYDRTDVDGALRAFGYKVKYASEDIDRTVAQETRTRDWSLEMSENPFDSNIAYYRHVSSDAGMEETADTLVQHFSEFGDEYTDSPEG
jgi:hypothetical protein